MEREEKSGKCLGVVPEHLGRKKVRCDGKGREPWRRESIHKRLWGVYKEAR